MAKQLQTVPVFVPALAVLLLHAEDEKGQPLTPEEVLRIRDEAPCIMMKPADAEQMAERRGGDLDPENCWYEWQMLRRELGRKPDLDPGAKISQIANDDPKYLQTIADAQATLGQFRAMLPDEASESNNAMVKTELSDSSYTAFMWLCNAWAQGDGFVAELFEVPGEFQDFEVGDLFEITADAVLDWMVNDEGVLYGGYSLRYYRASLPEEERAEYDDYIGVTRYA